MDYKIKQCLDNVRKPARYTGGEYNQVVKDKEQVDCRFALWKNNRFFTAKRKEITPQIAASFLEKGEALLQGCYSEKTGRSYDAKAVMEDDGQQTHFRLVFAHE